VLGGGWGKWNFLVRASHYIYRVQIRFSERGIRMFIVQPFYFCMRDDDFKEGFEEPHMKGMPAYPEDVTLDIHNDEWPNENLPRQLE
jgi:hypothetical protein